MIVITRYDKDALGDLSKQNTAERAERNNFPLHNHRVTKLSRVASFNATHEFLFLKTGILTIYTVLLNNKVVKRPIKWKIENF